MSPTPRVLWTKGVLLNPQHLQMQDRYLEEKLAFQLGTLTDYAWGFSELEIDREALESGAFAVARASGLFADGLAFDFPDADAAPSPKPLEDHWKPDQEAMKVYLAIPQYREGGRNVSARADDASTRYSPEILVRRDENTGGTEKEILVARKNFRFLAEGEPMEGSSAMPIARVVRAATGELELDPAFVPPLVDLSASDRVLSMARRLTDVLSAKSDSLGRMRRQLNQDVAEFGRHNVLNFWLLYTVNTHLSAFRNLSETRTDGAAVPGAGSREGRGHPVRLHRAMTALAASLMTFSLDRHPRDLPPYDHVELSAALSELETLIRELLETVVPTNHVTIPLAPEGGGVFAASIEEDRYLQANQAYLAVGAEMERDRLIDKIPSWIKVGSRGSIQDLMRQYLPGVGLSHVSRVPSSVPVKPGHVYFRLETAGQHWASVRQTRSVAAWVAAELPAPELELVLLLPAEKG